MGKKNSGAAWIFFFAGGMSLVIGLAQIGFRLSHDAYKNKLEREGALVEAVVKIKQHLSYRERFGRDHRTVTHWWIKYLPVGKQDTKKNLVWEDVSPRDFDKFKEGEKVRAWILGKEHYLRKRSGFYTEVPAWVFMLIGGGLLVGGVAVGKRARRRREEMEAAATLAEPPFSER